MSEFIRDPMQGGLLGVGLIVFSLVLSAGVKKSYSLRRSWHKLTLRIPLFGELIVKSALAKISMIQGNLAAAGVPVLEGLDIAAMSTNNVVIQEAMSDVKKGVFSGDPLSTLFAKRPEIFTSTFSAMVSVGERTGNMEEMFESISHFYEEETDATIQKLTAMLEPIMIVFMGATIGFILVALYTPMFNIGKVMQ